MGFDSTYGNYVVLAGDNNITITYGHLKEVNVSKDAIVSQNDIIGLMGKTGRATGVNLSFALSVDGEYINPLKYNILVLLMSMKCHTRWFLGVQYKYMIRY